MEGGEAGDFGGLWQGALGKGDLQALGQRVVQFTETGNVGLWTGFRAAGGGGDTQMFRNRRSFEHE